MYHDEKLQKSEILKFLKNLKKYLMNHFSGNPNSLRKKQLQKLSFLIISKRLHLVDEKYSIVYDDLVILEGL